MKRHWSGDTHDRKEPATHRVGKSNVPGIGNSKYEGPEGRSYMTDLYLRKISLVVVWITACGKGREEWEKEETGRKHGSGRWES